MRVLRILNNYFDKITQFEKLFIIIDNFGNQLVLKFEHFYNL